ncbi:glycosyltransferase 61 family protein [Asticcacaulis sp. AC402]|uniref:glycosyltransferase 61 family protein n=1 Tax=Asticcacaulis sp. AC402 TaxID=1282361 RepID=UPI00138AE2B3|nr:glycosyltransferase 61 family protein [Asticcacaulis sp. AC402]
MPELASLTVEFIANAYVLPLTKLHLAGAGRGHFDGGAYYADGNVCPAALHIKEAYDNQPVPFDTQGVTGQLEGSHVFGGMLQNEHFGHFMVESLCRLWALSTLDGDFRSLVYYNRIPRAPTANFIPQVLDLLCPGVPITLIREPTRIARLAVPTPICNPKNGVLLGHSAMAAMLAPVRALRGAGHKRIYVSRARLKPADGMILGETFIEKSLEAEGYHIVYPEELSISEQFKLYNDAYMLVFADGSAAHLYALVARRNQKVFIIWRRKLNYTYIRQIQSFGGYKVHGESTITELFVPADAPEAVTQGKGRPDFNSLKAQLQRAGCITGRGWQAPTEDDIRRQLADIEETLNIRLVRQTIQPGT